MRFASRENLARSAAWTQFLDGARA